MKIGMKKTVDVDVKTVSLNAKVRDEGYYTFKDQDGEVVHDYEGYVPGFFPGQHYGDYLDFVIDLETGQILNWDSGAVKRQLAEFINGEDD